eukprot:669339-Rhodomonas_salina.2
MPIPLSAYAPAMLSLLMRLRDCGYQPTGVLGYTSYPPTCLLCELPLSTYVSSAILLSDARTAPYCPTLLRRDIQYKPRVGASLWSYDFAGRCLYGPTLSLRGVRECCYQALRSRAGGSSRKPWTRSATTLIVRDHDRDRDRDRDPDPDPDRGRDHGSGRDRDRDRVRDHNHCGRCSTLRVTGPCRPLGSHGGSRAR